ncbi:MAG: RNase H family protein [Vicinamibacterales bacterium]
MTPIGITVFCDGAAKGNPGPGGWGVVVVTPDGHVAELGGRETHTTNNRMELTAAIQALSEIEAVDGVVAIYTDSTYVIKGIREWIHAWRRRGWKTVGGDDVLNRDLWERLARLADARGRGGVHWHYVRGHSGICGNERVDEIADGLARGESIALYQGPLAAYDRPILDVPDETGVPARRESSPGSGRPSKSARAHSYVSVVNGRAARHATWAECERHVKGQSGARYRKTTSAADEAAILRSWNIDPGTL